LIKKGRISGKSGKKEEKRKKKEEFYFSNT
jgi:hypothetical protein